MRIRSICTAVLLVLGAASLSAADTCEFDSTTDGAIVLQSTAGRPVEFVLKKPEGIAGKVTMCWLSEESVLDGKTCAAASTPDAAVEFSFGVCREADGKATNEFPSPAFDPDLLAEEAVKALILLYNPRTTGTHTDYLRIEWKEETEEPPAPPADPPAEEDADEDTPGDAQVDAPAEGQKVYKVLRHAGAERHDIDSRYRLWLYTGLSYFRSQNDFRDSYPELRLRFESRLVDERIFMRKFAPEEYRKITTSGLRPCRMNSTRNCAPHFRILRLYGDVGLTGTNVAVDIDGNAVLSGDVRQTFDGHFGIGFGKIMLVAQETPEHTDAFSVQGMARLGIITIPGQDVEGEDPLPGKSAFNYSLGFRVENESGHFQGAYFEAGWGQSEQFTLKQTPRLRLDGLLPINDPGGLFRIAGRMQLDMPRPFARSKYEGRNLEGEIRISLLFNIDLRELSHRLGRREAGHE